MSKSKGLLGSQNARALLLGRALALQTLIKGNSLAVITSEVIKILDLEDTDNPVLTGESLLEGVELRTFRGQSDATNTVDSLTSGEERVVVVVRHFVPRHNWLANMVLSAELGWFNLHEAVLHGGGGLVINAIFTASSEEVTLIDFVGPDTLRNTDHPEEFVQVIA